MDPLVILAGALTGLIVGVTGVGGGALMTPILLLFFGVAPTVAVGTDLWFAAITKLVAARVHHRHGLIDWQVARRLWVGSLPAVLGTLAYLKYGISEKPELSKLSLVIACVVTLTALGMLAQSSLHAIGLKKRLHDPGVFKMVQGPLTIACGALLGVLVTLTSIGAGALGAVFLAYLYPLRLTTARLIATDIVHAIPLALFAATGHLLIGNVDFVLLATLLVGSLPFSLLGAYLSSRMPMYPLKLVLSAILLVVAVKLFWQVLARA